MLNLITAVGLLRNPVSLWKKMDFVSILAVSRRPKIASDSSLHLKYKEERVDTGKTISMKYE